jgi:hypothetical protein
VFPDLKDAIDAFLHEPQTRFLAAAETAAAPGF